MKCAQRGHDRVQNRARLVDVKCSAAADPLREWAPVESVVSDIRFSVDDPGRDVGRQVRGTERCREAVSRQEPVHRAQVVDGCGVEHLQGDAHVAALGGIDGPVGTGSDFAGDSEVTKRVADSQTDGRTKHLVDDLGELGGRVALGAEDGFDQRGDGVPLLAMVG